MIGDRLAGSRDAPPPHAYPKASGMATLEFWFEFASTYSYPAAMRIEALAREEDIAVVWKPFLLGPIFRRQGWTDSPFNVYPVQGRYMWRDLERICADLKIPLRRPSPASRRFPPRIGSRLSRLPTPSGRTRRQGILARTL